MGRKVLIIKFLSFLYLPHFIAFLTSRNRFLIEEDLKTMSLRTHFESNILCTLTYHLWSNRYYRHIFYKRLGKWSRYLFWYMPGPSTFDPCCSKIGGGIYCAHPFATILNAKSIGRNFSFRNNTTIGNKYDGGTDLPVIGDNVSLGANVVIIGDITIGNNVVVGAGSVVVKSIPDNAIAVGNPAKVIKYNE